MSMPLMLIASLLLLLTALVPAPAECAETIRIGGSGSGLALMRQLGSSFMKQHPDLQVKIVSSLGSTGGIKALSAGALEIAVSSRPPKGDERGFETLRIGSTPLVFAVHPKVNRKNITIDELEQIYAGLTSSWPDGSRLRLVLRPEQETDTQLLRKLSPTLDRAITAALGRHGMLLAVNDQDNLRLLERTPGSIGPITLAMLTAEHSTLQVLSYNGSKASLKTLANGQYPLRRELYLVIRPAVGPATRQFIAFVRSPAGRQMLEKLNCLPSE